MDIEKIADFEILALVSTEPDSNGNCGEVAFTHKNCGNGINTRSSKVVGAMAVAWMANHLKECK